MRLTCSTTIALCFTCVCAASAASVSTVISNSTPEPPLTNSSLAARIATRQLETAQTAARLAELATIAANTYQSTASLSIATAALQQPLAAAPAIEALPETISV